MLRMPHMHKFAYIFPHMWSHFFSIFLVQCCFKTTKYFGYKRLLVFEIIDVEKIEVKNVETVQKRPINDHDYDYPSLEFAYICQKYAGKYSALHMHHICCIYAPHISPNSAYFSAYFACKSSGYFEKTLRYKLTSLASTLCHIRMHEQIYTWVFCEVFDVRNFNFLLVWIVCSLLHSFACWYDSTYSGAFYGTVPFASIVRQRTQVMYSEPFNGIHSEWHYAGFGA